MTRINVNPRVLQWASNRSAKDRGALDERFPKLGRWLAGDENPTFNQLEQFAKATFTPLGFLFLQAPPVETMPIPHYRTANDGGVGIPSSELLDTIYTMQRRQEWLREYLTTEGRERVALVNCAKQNESPTIVANRLRELLGLRVDWAARHTAWTEALRELRDAMGDVGVTVVVNGIVGNNTHRALNVEEFRGFVLVDEHAPLVFVNGADGKAAQMFTLAHELAHLAFGSSAAFDLRQMEPATAPIEQSCNKVAAEFLVPEIVLRQIWNTQDPNPYDTVARRFKVSPIVAGRRLMDLNFITREAFFAFYLNYVAQERQQRQAAESGGNFYATAAQRVGMRFAVEIVKALKEGKVLYTEAYRLVGMNGKTFDEFAKIAWQGGVP